MNILSNERSKGPFLHLLCLALTIFIPYQDTKDHFLFCFSNDNLQTKIQRNVLTQLNILPHYIFKNLNILMSKCLEKMKKPEANI